MANTIFIMESLICIIKSEICKHEKSSCNKNHQNIYENSVKICVMKILHVYISRKSFYNYYYKLVYKSEESNVYNVVICGSEFNSTLELLPYPELLKFNARKTE